MTQDTWTKPTPGAFDSWTDSSAWSLGAQPTSTEDAYLGSTTFADVVIPSNETANSIAADSSDILDIANDSVFTTAAGTGSNVNEGEILDGFGTLIIDGTFDNGKTGVVELAPATDFGVPGELITTRSLTLTGSGAFEMQIGSGPASNEIVGVSEITTPNFINQTETISGTGTIGNHLNFTNDALVETNNSTSSGPGFLTILASAEGGSFTNNGTVQADNGGTIEFGADGKSATVDNENLITANSSGSSTFLQVAGNVTIDALAAGTIGTIILQGTNPSDDNIGSDGNAATLDLIDQTLSGAGHVGDMDITLTVSLGSMIEADDSGQFLVLYTGSNTIHSTGILIANNGGILSIDSDVNNSNTIDALAGSAVNIAASISGTGSIDIDSDGTVALIVGTVSQNVNFAGSGGSFVLDASGLFTADIVGMAAGDSVEIAGSFTAGEHAVWQQTTSSAGTLSLYSNGVDLYTLKLTGTYSTLNFVVSSGGVGETLVTEQNTPSYPEFSGNNDEWILSDGNWVESAGPGSHPSGYNVAGTGDWTGDGTDGILWFNPTTGDADEWQFSNTQWSISVDLGTHPVNATDGASYQIAGTDASTDFPGNGIDDVLWTSPNSDGTIATDIWELSSSGKWSASVSPGSHPADYTVAGTGDWTGDGTDGILWYNASTGDTDEWQLSNGQWAHSVDLGSHPLNSDGNSYQIAGIGDFFDNGIDDVLWTSVNSDGTIATDIWQLNSSGNWTSTPGGSSPGTHPAGYEVVAVGDFTATGTSDILWFNPTTGDTDEWLINNGKWAASMDLGTHPGNFQIAGVGDFNGDGTKDILWHSAS